MRIISGNFKNKKLFEPNDSYTRPLKDLVKESIFNIIEHSKLVKFKIENCEVLDLFSGSGSFGLECISRGAKKVLFCENYIPVTKILNKNIANLKCKKNTDIYVDDVFKLLNNKSFLINKLGVDKYDIVLISWLINSIDAFPDFITSSVAQKNHFIASTSVLTNFSSLSTCTLKY